MSPFDHHKPGSMHPGRVARIFAACNGHCCGCGIKLRSGMDYEIDHRIALANGGTDDDSNLQVLCEGCHLIKTGGAVSDAAKSKRVYTKQNVPKRYKQSKGWGR